jgi:hypothetical protein
VARLSTWGFETKQVGANVSWGHAEGNGLGGGVGPAAVATPRSGNWSAQFASGTGNSSCTIRRGGSTANVEPQWVGGRTYYFRAYFQFTNLPSAANTKIVRFGFSNGISVRLTTGGKLQLWNDMAGTQIGSNSATTLAAGSTWYRVELAITISSDLSAVTAAEVRLDGVTVAAATGLNLNGSPPASASFECGWVTAPGASKTCRIDDCALNDSTGSDQNSWPGDGNVVLLLPISDNARGNWTGGAGGTTNLFAAVDNLPPTGASGTGTNTSQIKTLAVSATDNYDVNLAAYSTALSSGGGGIPAGQVIDVVQTVVEADGDQTATVAFGIQIVSNPSGPEQSAVTLGGTNAWPTGWVGYCLGSNQTVHSPTVVLGTNPVMRVGKRQATTDTLQVCFMGLYVEYGPAPPGITVVATPATALASGLAPLVKPLVGSAAPATAVAPAPKVKLPGSAAVSRATASAPAPALKLRVVAPAAGASAVFLGPAIRGAAMVNPPAARATASAPAPAIKYPASVPAVLAEATASMPAPHLKVGDKPSAAGAVASMPAPTLRLTVARAVSVTAAQATASMPTGIVVPIFAIVQVVCAEATASMPVPNIVASPLDPTAPTDPSDEFVLVPVYEFVETPS